MSKTGIVRDPVYMNHFMGPYHPESPRRLEVIYELLDEPGMKGRFVEIPRREASRDELLLVHSPVYVDRLEETRGKEYTYLDPDTQTCAGSFDAAVSAAGSLCQAVSMVNAEELQNAFALVRPPGHHAEKGRAMGFCLLNNVAIAAKFAREILRLERILIVDWDLHHGNGTQHSFEADPTVLYFSTHQYPYYPGTGAFNEIGTGEGKGYTVNVPLTVGHGDCEYVSIFEEILKPIALEFKPDLILTSAGFDIYMHDPLGGMEVTAEGFAALTRSLMEIALQCCRGKLVITLEGGYHLQGLRDSVRAVLDELSGVSETDIRLFGDRADRAMLQRALQNASKVHKPYWKNL